MIGDYLAYVSAVVQDVEGVASILESEFQLPRSDLTVGSSGRRAPVFSVGQTGLALFEMGDEFVGGAERRGVHHLAVAVDGMVSAAMEAGSLGVPSRSAGPEWGLGGAQRMLLDPQATGGVIVYLSERLSLPSGDAGQVERIDHIGVASEDNNLALEVFARKLGWTVESTQTDTEISQPFESFTSDKYGVTYRAGQPRVVGGVRVAFVTIGDCELEFLQNIDPDSSASVEHGRPGSTSQDQGVITRFIESRGPGLHHLALKVRDINGLLARLESAGLALIDHAGRPGSRRAQIGFVHPASLGGLLVHLVQRDEV